MYELIKNNLFLYTFITVFTGIWLSLVIKVIYKKSKNIESKKIKLVLRFGVSGVLVCCWLWFFVYINLFPISSAYYDYTHNFTEEKIGVIDSIEQTVKDRVNLTINGEKYTMVYSYESPFIAGTDFDVGDTVNFKFGKNSKFIFNIQT